MQGLGTIVEQNSDNATLLRILAERRFPKFAEQIKDAPSGIFPAPILWGDNLLAIAWHQERNGQLIHIQVLDTKAVKKFFRQLPKAARTKILRSCGEPDEA